jgi:hypothetical protein
VGAAWSIVTIFVPITTVPVRAAPERFTPISKVTEPRPEPVAPAVTPIQSSDGAATQLQVLPVVTKVVTVVRPPETEKLEGATVYTQLFACCVTVTVWPATTRVPVRGCEVGLGATANVAPPRPVPLPATIVIQSALLVDDHEQNAPVMTETVWFPPVDDAETAVVGRE